MNIQQLLKKEKANAKVSSDNKWLVWDGAEWLVQERLYHKKNNIVLYRGCSLGVALDVLYSGEATYDKV